MTNYFKIYLTGRKGREEYVLKKKEDVIELIQKANKAGYISYLIIKRIKQGTDVLIARGNFSKECKVVYVDGLDIDWRIVGANVVNWDKYKKVKEDEERC